MRQRLFGFGMMSFTFRAYGLAIRAVLRWTNLCRVVGDVPDMNGSGVFLIANHRSIADAVMLYLTCGCRLAGPAKAELFRIPVFGWALRRMGAFPVARDGMDFRAARSVADAFRAGGTVVIFPEGHRSRTGAMLPFAPNLARLMIKLEAPMIPIGIAGTYELLPPGRWLPRRSPVVVVYGTPFELSQFYGRPVSREDSLRAAAIMQDHVAQALDLAEAEREGMIRVRGSV